MKLTDKMLKKLIKEDLEKIQEGNWFTDIFGEPKNTNQGQIGATPEQTQGNQMEKIRLTLAQPIGPDSLRDTTLITMLRTQLQKQGRSHSGIGKRIPIDNTNPKLAKVFDVEIMK